MEARVRPRSVNSEPSTDPGMKMTEKNGSSGYQYRGLREWIDCVDKMGELQRVVGAHWDTEMGAITHMLTEQSRGNAPAFLFDEIPDYEKGFRTLYGEFSSVRRVALTLGLPLEYERKVDIVKSYHARLQDLKPLPPRYVDDGPVLRNVLEGDEVDVLKFPVPRHHERDTARYIGTANCVITQDPDDGWFNLGTYRNQVYDAKRIGCQITEGKHGRIHRDKNFERGKPMKVVVLCGQDPLLFMLSASPLPDGISEMDIAGGLRGEPIDVVRGPYTGYPIPADAEIAIEGEMVPGNVLPEGPFGEWMGYYSDDVQSRAYMDVKSILYRDDPILTCAPQHKPVDETGLLKGIAGSAQVWRALEACGLPDILGVWNHEAGPATRFTAIQIKQRYPGHARNALHVASSCQGGAYAGKWTVVVDEDIDAGDLDQVLWAMCTRFDPVTDIDLVQKAWASKRDPLFLPGNFNNRILIDACIPYDMKLKDKFPAVVDVSPDLRKQLRAKFPQLF
jgi:UbiD family decarboxylase